MNIFILDSDPVKATQYHSDKHCIKMILETAQLLCGVHWISGSNTPFKLTHKNHPCSVWARECLENYIWLSELGISLCNEYTYRYNKIHKSQSIIELCINNTPNIKINGNMTPFIKAMPNECKIGNTINSYRIYYMTHKRKFASWKNREIPEWFK